MSKTARQKHGDYPLLRRIARQAAKYRNITRGYRAEDKTKPLPANMPEEEIGQYAAHLELDLFKLLDEWEDGEGHG